MGIELDVLVGHPEHELLFISTQVARAVGLKNPSNAVSSFRSHNADVKGLIQFREVLSVYHSLGDCKNVDGVYQQLVGRPNSSVIQVNSWMGTESWVYQMLMRGDLKSANDFRSWIADEVAPTIRKTGSYNAAESDNPIAVGIMDELKALRGEVVELKEIVKASCCWVVTAQSVLVISDTGSICPHYWETPNQPSGGPYHVQPNRNAIPGRPSGPLRDRPSEPLGLVPYQSHNWPQWPGRPSR
ncbi:BRO family protein [Pseudomonas sp. MN1F]|uniref:BRO family protein n=1 Tax=Pseudomonas sp. MN1F TaxID=1366632 RepID=UPI00128ECE7A|nr:BRO family protein [Pseudomonas sp. MN1F]MQG91683.1 hypothetical protein [Pseudomonas sp. MN1F]